jgi:hypothetical protein
VAVPPWIAAMDATMAGPVLATVSWLLPATVRVLTQMSPAAMLYRTALSARFAMRECCVSNHVHIVTG